nr:zinc finger, CCHC-type [Tanacetum cinerariifolium]
SSLSQLRPDSVTKSLTPLLDGSRRVVKKEVMRWELEAKNRTLGENERVIWMEARKAWLDKEAEYRNDAASLEKEFSEEEIVDVIRSCEGDKASGPDGFNFKYIRKFLEIIKSDLVRAVKWFGETPEISRGCNASFAKQEIFKTVKALHACKQEKGKSVSSYLLKMKSYLGTSECLGYAMLNKLCVSLILNSLNKDYDQFVQNYNMHSMRKTIAE